MAQDEKNPRIVILLDGSSSMLHDWTKDNIRFEAAARIIDKLMDSVYSVNKDVEFSLRVYGHQSPTSVNNCFDSKQEVMFSKDNYTQMMLRLAALHPLGISPIAYSIQQSAENDMQNLKDYKYSLILITDGGESCEGDICKVVETLLRKKIDFKPYIISLIDYDPLRTQYACMGEYLLAAKPEDIEPVVGKIVEAYRNTFIQPRTTRKIIESASKTPSALRVTKPAFKVEVPVTEEPKPEPIKQAPKPEPVVVAPKKDTVVIKAPEPKPIIPEPQKKSNIIVTEIPERKKQEPGVLMPTKRQRILPVIYLSKNFAVVPVPKVTMPEIVVESEKPKEPVYKPMAVTKPSTIPVTPPKKPEQQIAEYKVVREETAETTFEVYFTDGKGKYYETSPELVLRDMKTNEPVYKFYRDVDVYGKPRPQKNMPVGTYNVTVTGKDGLVWKAIEIRKNQKNKYEFIVSKGSLAFTYTGNPGRPVTEFNARVSVALKRNMVNKQACSDVVPYEPENYHIEINTNPISHRNADLDFGAVVYISIEEPGQIKVLNPLGHKSITFLYQHGDRFEDFRPINVTGNASKQEFLIQPGRYKIAYLADPNVPNPKPKVKDFIIKSNTITEIILD